MNNVPDPLRGKNATKGNQRAKKSGAHGELTLAPVREERARLLRERFPELDGIRLALLADRLARVSVASAWLDERGTVLKDRHGHVFDVADRVEKWANRAEQVLAEIEAEQRGAKRIDTALEMSRLAPTEGENADG